MVAPARNHRHAEGLRRSRLAAHKPLVVPLAVRIVLNFQLAGAPRVERQPQVKAPQILLFFEVIAVYARCGAPPDALLQRPLRTVYAHERLCVRVEVI